MLTCPQCGTQLAETLLACPSCDHLVHAERLNRLASEAEQAARAQDLSHALAKWREVLDLLPPGTTQHQAVTAKITTLSRSVPSAGSKRATDGSTAASPRIGQKVTGIGLLGLLAWKLKFILILLLTKAKLLLFGFTQAGTFFSMLLSFSIYWTVWGWKFALGLVMSIYIHEMGHVLALRRYGIRASAPMFIPGLGAFIQAKQHPLHPGEDARVGLAGPWWGLGTAWASCAVFRMTGWGTWGALAKVGAWITLFNLAPIWQLDGSRGFSALSRLQRWTVVAVAAFAWWMTREGLLVLLCLLAAFRSLGHDAPRRGDRPVWLHYMMLMLASTWMTLLRVHLP